MIVSNGRHVAMLLAVLCSTTSAGDAFSTPTAFGVAPGSGLRPRPSEQPSSLQSALAMKSPTAKYFDAMDGNVRGGAATYANVRGGSTSTTTGNASSAAVLSTSYLILADVVLRRVFRSLEIAFPSSLAGCGLLFGTLLATTAADAKTGESLYSKLSPGAAVLAKWLPVFFVPSLVTLPLAPSLGDASELAKVAVVIVGGFFFTLLTTAWSVTGVRKLGSTKTPALTSPSSSPSSGTANTDYLSSLPSTAGSVTKAAPKAFSDDTFNFLTGGAVTAAVLSTVASRIFDASAALTTPLQSSCMLFATLATFVYGARLPKKFTKVVHPLVTCTGLTWVVANVLGLLTSLDFTSVLRAYKVGGLSFTAGAGDVLLFLLGPAVVALACQMYDRRALMRKNTLEVGTAVVASSVGGLFGTALLVRALALKSSVLRLSLLSRNITSPLAMAIASLLGGADVSLAVSMVVVSGLIGANFGARILDACGIHDPVARGLGVGASAHGLGTAAFAGETDAFPFAAIAMALTASFSTVLVSVTPVRRALRTLALGGL